MATKFFSKRNLEFLLHEVHDVSSLTQYDYYKDHNKKMFDMVLKAAEKLGKDLLFPTFEEMDRQPPELVDGVVKVHPTVKKVLKEFAEGGWMTSLLPYDLDGDQLPTMIGNASLFIFNAANYSAAAYSGLTIGAAGLLVSYGSKTLRDIYEKKMFSGAWQGTMALTEPEAGSSLGDIATTATPTEAGHYLIEGQKVFISAGDHDAVDNVVHMMLARIKGAPAGVKGISLFVVPKKRPGDDGQLVANDVKTSGIYHKLGYRGCPIAQLSMGDGNDCHGWLIGEPNHGLKYMFQMMNGARIHVGLGAISKSTAAYYATLEYTKTRCQGRKLNDKDPNQPQIPIIEHADIKRMLLFQKSVNEGATALMLLCSKYEDLVHVLPEGEEKEKYELLLDILTPILKTYPSEMGIQTISAGLQCFGGSGFVDDYPLEQYYRDIRIDPIHEGTTGVQGMDLLGRKVAMNNGKAFALFLEEVNQSIAAAEACPELKSSTEKLKETLTILQEVTAELFQVAGTEGAEVFLADSVLYLEMFGIVTIAWQWLVQGVAALKGQATAKSKNELNFYQGKLVALQYFFSYELPKTQALVTRLLEKNPITVEMETCFFDD